MGKKVNNQSLLIYLLIYFWHQGHLFMLKLFTGIFFFFKFKTFQGNFFLEYLTKFCRCHLITEQCLSKRILASNGQVKTLRPKIFDSSPDVRLYRKLTGKNLKSHSVKTVRSQFFGKYNFMSKILWLTFRNLTPLKMD